MQRPPKRQLFRSVKMQILNFETFFPTTGALFMQYVSIDVCDPVCLLSCGRIYDVDTAPMQLLNASRVEAVIFIG